MMVKVQEQMIENMGWEEVRNIIITSSQSETIPSPPLPLMEVTIKQEHSLNIVKHC